MIEEAEVKEDFNPWGHIIGSGRTILPLVGVFGRPLHHCYLQCLKRVVTMYNSRENHAGEVELPFREFKANGTVP